MSDSENVSAETSATAGPKQLDVDDKFLLLLEQIQQMNGNITRLLSGDDHSSEPDHDDPPDRGESSTQDIETTQAPLGGHKALLKAIAQDLNLKDKTGPAIEGELTELMNALLKDKMSADVLKTKLDQYLRPENVEGGLRTPKVNPLIWNQISASMRTLDSGSQKNQSTLVGSTIAMAKAADRVMKKYAEDSELLALVTDAIALAIQCHHEASYARRLAMKKELHKDYGSVCSTVMGTSDFLFGDLSKLTNANELTKKMRPSQSTGRGDMYRAHSHRRHGSFAGRVGNRFHPYQYQGSKNSHFLGRSPYLKLKKKKEGSERATAPLIPKVCEKLVMSSRSDVVQNMLAKQTSFKAGRLRNFLAQWEGLTSDPVILQYVTGVQIESKGDIFPRKISHRPSIFNAKNQAIVQAEIDKLITKGVIVRSSSEKGDFVSTIFLRPKKDGSHCTILNLKQFNEFVSPL